MAVFVKNYVTGCALCQQNKVNTHPTTPPLMPIKADKDALPFSTIGMDFITDLPESNGYTALYVVVDHNLSKGIVLIPCTKEETSTTTAKLYHDHVYRRFGLPRAMISDRGPQFASKVFQELCDRLGVQSRLSTAYHPQTDGQTERMNREIEAYLRIYCGSHPDTWAEHLPDLEFSHNQRANANNGKTPFEIIMGYNPIAIPTVLISSRFPALEERLRDLRDIRKEALAAHEMARVRMAERITRSFTPFKEGDKVWLEAKNLNVGGAYRKLRTLREGPFVINEVLGPLTYRLQLPKAWKVHPVFHAALLSPYKQTAVHGPAYAEPPPEEVNGEEEWEPEAIIGHRKQRGGSYRYLVKWKEYPSSENSYEPEEHLANSKELLDAYKKRLNLASVDIGSTWITTPLPFTSSQDLLSSLLPYTPPTIFTPGTSTSFETASIGSDNG
jgi:transposase InsO family protein